MPAALLRVAARALLVALAALVAVTGTQVAQGATKATAAEARSVASAPSASASASAAERTAAPALATAPEERDTPGCGKSGSASQDVVPSTRAGGDAGIVPVAGRGTSGQATAPVLGRVTAEDRRPPGPSLAQLSVLRL
ncbi:hypothetical protein DVA86_02465 [Streptomyces armeniacus]|uniref:Uncharacterized protein n=1 Tax=Streptomyces armeniacus TaxID=83291 RepID=A0A345XZG4_9ACTN|nr:hypothetical protein DVA86_02465 [Streptomyces armeniacus]